MGSGTRVLSSVFSAFLYLGTHRIMGCLILCGILVATLLNGVDNDDDDGNHNRAGKALR